MNHCLTQQLQQKDKSLKPRKIFEIKNSDGIFIDNSQGRNNNSNDSNNNIDTVGDGVDFERVSITKLPKKSSSTGAIDSTTTNAMNTCVNPGGGGGGGGSVGKVDNSELESFLSKKLSQLTMEERTKGIYELHGVADIEKETPEMWTRKIQEVTQIVNSFDEEDTAAYRIAVKQSKEYVDKIKRLCLRADYHDSQKAAARMASFFALKQSIFENDDILGRDITLQDLHEEDIELLKDGTIQLLSMRDRAGRAIIWMVGSRFPKLNAQSVARAYIYMNLIALQDEETQIKGAVVVFYSIGQKVFYSNRPSKLSQILPLIPIRYVAYHLCYDSPALHSFAKMMAQSMEGHYLCRFRSHFGSPLDCIYSLMTFGIAQEVMPVDAATGEPDTKPFAQWIEVQKSLESLEKPKTVVIEDDCDDIQEVSSTTNSDTPSSQEEQSLFSSSPSKSLPTTSNTTTGQRIIIPGPMDIFLGRGRRSYDSAGYMRFRTLLDEHLEEYDNAKRYDRRIIANNLRLQLESMGCRLLKRMPGSYMVVCDETEFTEKICHAFRNIRNAAERKGKESTVVIGRDEGMQKRMLS